MVSAVSPVRSAYGVNNFGIVLSDFEVEALRPIMRIKLSYLRAVSCIYLERSMVKVRRRGRIGSRHLQEAFPQSPDRAAAARTGLAALEQWQRWTTG